MTTKQLIERLRNNFAVDNGEILSHLTTLEKRAEAGEKLASAIADCGFGDYMSVVNALSAYRSATQDSVREE